MVPPNSAHPAPLTSKGVDGTPYTRRADIEAGIARAQGMSCEEWQAWATSADERMPAEVLVYLIRQVQLTRRDVFGSLVYELGIRTAQIAKKWSRGFDRDTTEEIIWGVEKTITDLVIAPIASRKSEFLEVAFSLAVKRYVLNAVEKRRNAPLPLRDRESFSADEEGEEPERPTERVVDEGPQTHEIVEQLKDREQRARLLRLAQKSVKDPRHYEALFLHYGFDWPIFSMDEAKKDATLAGYFSTSERQIRNWIRDGLAAIQKVLGDT
jgi:hypothetical protein